MSNLPYITDYALTCMRHPDLEAGYRQWLVVVSAWGYDITSQFNGELVWSIGYYKSLWTNQ